MTDNCICCGEILHEGMTACPKCLLTVKRLGVNNNHVDEIDFDYAAEDDNA